MYPAEDFRLERECSGPMARRFVKQSRKINRQGRRTLALKMYGRC